MAAATGGGGGGGGGAAAPAEEKKEEKEEEEEEEDDDMVRSYLFGATSVLYLVKLCLELEPHVCLQCFIYCKVCIIIAPSVDRYVLSAQGFSLFD